MIKKILFIFSLCLMSFSSYSYNYINYKNFYYGLKGNVFTDARKTKILLKNIEKEKGKHYTIIVAKSAYIIWCETNKLSSVNDYINAIILYTKLRLYKISLEDLVSDLKYYPYCFKKVNNYIINRYPINDNYLIYYQSIELILQMINGEFFYLPKTEVYLKQ